MLVRTPEMVITRGDWEAELTRIPNDQRMAFTASSQRVQAAPQQRAHQPDARRARPRQGDSTGTPTMARRLTLETERFLAALMIGPDRDRCR